MARDIPQGKRRTQSLPIDLSEDVSRPSSMPPRLAHRLSGQLEEPRIMSPHERRRQILKRTYPPWRPLFQLLGGRSMSHLARQVGTNQAHLTKILRGFKEPHFFTGVRICLALGLTMEQLDAYLTRVSRNPLL